MNRDYSTEELMTVAIARELDNDDVAFVGLGTGGRAFALAVGIPTAACQLAKLIHAPMLNLMLGPIINPDPAHQPDCYSDSHLISWPCEAQISVYQCLDCFRLGKITVSFVSGSQVDRYGNLNIVAIGDLRQPNVRLVGPIAQTDHLGSPARNIIVNDLSKKTFVDRVDFVSGASYLEGGASRLQAGLPEQGAWRVVTDRALFEFDEESKQMAVRFLYPQVTSDDVASQLQFKPLRLHQAAEIEPPTDEELSLLRTKVDPKGNLLRGTIR